MSFFKRLRKFPFFLSWQRVFFLSWTDMEFCHFFSHPLRWSHGFSFYYVNTVYYIDWFSKVNPNLNFWDKTYLLMLYYYPFIPWNSICYKVRILTAVFVWVLACSFPFSSHPPLITVSRQSCLMEQGGVCPLLCYGGTCVELTLLIL